MPGPVTSSLPPRHGSGGNKSRVCSPPTRRRAGCDPAPGGDLGVLPGLGGGRSMAPHLGASPWDFRAGGSSCVLEHRYFVGLLGFFSLQEIDLFLIPFGSQGWMFPHVGHRVPWESGGSGCAAPGAAGDKGPGCSPSCSSLAGTPSPPCASVSPFWCCSDWEPPCWQPFKTNTL